MLDHFMGMELHLWCLGVLYTTFGDIQLISYFFIFHTTVTIVGS